MKYIENHNNGYSTLTIRGIKYTSYYHAAKLLGLNNVKEFAKIIEYLKCKDKNKNEEFQGAYYIETEYLKKTILPLYKYYNTYKERYIEKMTPFTKNIIKKIGGI